MKSPLKTSFRAALATTVAAISLVSSAGLAHAGTAGGLGDGNGDGNADIWATSGVKRYSTWSENGMTTFFKGTLTVFTHAGPSFGISKVSTSDMGLGAADQVVALPDMTGDKRADLLARFSDHLYLYKNTGSGTVTRSTEIGHGWGAFDNIIYAGHLNGGTDQYLLARRTTDQSLWAYKFTASGGLTDMGQAGTNWGGIRFMLAPGQITGDSKDDLMAIDKTGNMNCYRSVGLGKLSNAGVCGHGWNGFQSAFIVGDVDGSGSWDLVGVKYVTHPSSSCDANTPGVCDPVEPLCTDNPASVANGQYASEYEVPPSTTDECIKEGKKYRLKPDYRAPMYAYQNLGNAQWGAGRRIGYDMFLYSKFA